LVARIENDGNVHLQPVGEIIIRNMWGAERGRIPVNLNTSFGNVLPNTVREYRFGWQKDPSLFDIGYYTATLSLAYGTEARQFLRAETGFWVIPLRPLAIAIGIIALIVVSIFAVSRWYVARLLRSAGVGSLSETQTIRSTPVQSVGKVSTMTDLDLTAQTTPNSQRWLAQIKCWQKSFLNLLFEVFAYVRYYYAVIIRTRQRLMVLLLIGLLLTGLWVWSRANDDRRNDYVTQVGNGSDMVTYNAEEITFFQHPGMSPAILATSSSYTIRVVNESDRTGAAGALAATIAKEFPVVAVQPGAQSRRSATAIVFPTNLQKEAMALNEALGGVLLSATVEATTTEIVIYVGNDWTW